MNKKYIDRLKKQADGDLPTITPKSILLEGQYIPLPKPLIKFMGLNNVVFLVGLIDHYNYLSKKNLVKNKTLFYEAKIFEKNWDVSIYQQNKAIKELARIGLLKRVGRGYRNTKNLKINMNRCCCLFQLINDMPDEMDLRSFFKKMQKKGKVRNMMKKWLKGMGKEWNSMSFPVDGPFDYIKFVELLIEKLI